MSVSVRGMCYQRGGRSFRVINTICINSHVFITPNTVSKNKSNLNNIYTAYRLSASDKSSIAVLKSDVHVAFGATRTYINLF